MEFFSLKSNGYFPKGSKGGWREYCQPHIRRATMVHKLNQFAKHLPDKWVKYHPTTKKKMANCFKCQMPFVEYDCHGLFHFVLPICNSTHFFVKIKGGSIFFGGGAKSTCSSCSSWCILHTSDGNYKKPTEAHVNVFRTVSGTRSTMWSLKLRTARVFFEFNTLPQKQKKNGSHSMICMIYLPTCSIKNQFNM